MTDTLGLWMLENAGLFRYIGELGCLREGAGSVLLSGDASAFLSSTLRALFPDAAITAVDSNLRRLEEAREEDSALEIIEAPFETWLEDRRYDVIVSALQAQKLDSRELVPYLFNLLEMSAPGASLFLSFPSTSILTGQGKREVEAWHNSKELTYFKRYLPEDMARALGIIGFHINAIELDENADLGQVVSIHAHKH